MRALTLLLAERIEVDPDGRVSIHRAFDRVVVAGFPQDKRVAVLAEFEVTPDEAGREIEIGLQLQDRAARSIPQQMTWRRRPPSFRSPRDHAVWHEELRCSLHFVEPGDHLVSLFIDGYHAIDRPLHVDLLTV